MNTPGKWMAACTGACLLFSLAACATSTQASFIAEQYRHGSAEERNASLDQLAELGDEALPTLRSMATTAWKSFRTASTAEQASGCFEEYRSMLKTFARMETENAALELVHQSALHDRAAIEALADMGEVGLPHLKALSQEKHYELLFPGGPIPHLCHSLTPRGEIARQTLKRLAATKPSGP